MDIEEQIVSYQDVIDGLEIKGDDLGVAEYALAPARKKTFLSNPFILSTEQCMLYLQRVDGCVAGRMMYFPGRFYNGVEIVPSCGASALEVHDNYRDLTIGADLAMFPLFQDNKVLIYSDFSEEGIEACRALKFNIFSIPKYYYFLHHSILLETIGINSFLGKIIGGIIDKVVSLHRFNVRLLQGRLDKYKVEKISIVPEWVDDIVLKDGHKYMEVHDHTWLQWNLDNLFHDDAGNVNSFYVVTQNGKNLGFFMTKTRWNKMEKHHATPKLVGAIMEWGTVDKEKLSEEQIYRLALASFDKKIHFVTMAIEDKSVVERLKKYILFRRGDHTIAYKDIKKQYKDSSNPSLWRLRYGYADSIFN